MSKPTDETSGKTRGRPPLPEGGGERATSTIVLRVTPRRKAAYVRAAKPGTLADWIFGACDASSGYVEE